MKFLDPWLSVPALRQVWLYRKKMYQYLINTLYSRLMKSVNIISYGPITNVRLQFYKKHSTYRYDIRNIAIFIVIDLKFDSMSDTPPGRTITLREDPCHEQREHRIRSSFGQSCSSNKGWQ